MAESTELLSTEHLTSDDGQAVSMVDCDVHCYPDSIQDLLPHLPRRWQAYVEKSGFKGPPGAIYPKGFEFASRRDAWPPNGKRPGADPNFARDQLLDTWNIDFAILNPLYDVAAVHNIDYANFLFGDPQKVLASSIQLTTATAQDTITAIVRYPKSDQLVLSWSWGTAPSGAGADDVLGTEGALLFGPGENLGEKIDLKTHGYYRVTNRRTRRSRLVRFRRRDMYVTQGRHFLACIASRETCRSPGTEAIKAIGVGEAILKAGPNSVMRRVTW